MTEAPPPPIEDEDDPTTIMDMLATGATYRQVDYWCRSGYLTPGREREAALPGSGNNRVWSRRDVAVCRIMVRLTKAGVIVPVAAEAAHSMVEHGRDTVHINGVEITLLREDEGW